MGYIDHRFQQIFMHKGLLCWQIFMYKGLNVSRYSCTKVFYVKGDGGILQYHGIAYQVYCWSMNSVYLVAYTAAVVQRPKKRVDHSSGVPLLRPTSDKPLQVALSLFRYYPSFKTVIALIRDEANIGLKSGVYSSSRALVRSWAGLSRQIRGLLYTYIRVIFPPKTGLGDRRSIGLMFFYRDKPIYLVLSLLLVWP